MYVFMMQRIIAIMVVFDPLFQHKDKVMNCFKTSNYTVKPALVTATIKQ